MRVLLSGYYGFGNLGDEALLEVIVAQLRARFPGVVVDALSATPRETSQRLGIEATQRWNMRDVKTAIERADVVLSGGGGLLQSATSLRSLVYYAGILREAARRNRKTMIFAQSIGPLDAIGKFVVKTFCRRVDRATVRDARSRQLLEELIPAMKVEQTADPVFLYDLPVEELDLSREGLGDAPYAIVSVRKIPALKEGLQTIARVVDRLAQTHGVRVAFLPIGGVSDAEVSTDIIRLCKSAPMLLPECSLERAAAIVRGAHVVIGMRLHALIFAARFAVPFLAIPYDPKVQSLCDDLEYPLEPLWLPGKGAPAGDRVDGLVDRLLSEHGAISSRLRERISAIRTSAARNFEVLGELVGATMSETVERDYRDTLLLPKTAFPMKAELPKREPARVAWWKEQQTYQRRLERNRANAPWILHDGPPYANGELHVGHFLNMVLKDMFVKIALLDDRWADFVPGWDMHGLPIELETLKFLGIKDFHAIDPLELREKCRERALYWLDVQRAARMRMGNFGHFDRPYRTIDPYYEAAIVNALAELAEKNQLYKGLRSTLWCVHDETALAEAEIEYEPKVSPSIYVRFTANAEQREAMLRMFGDSTLTLPLSVLIWTTTPWTLPANVAIALRADATYGLYRLGDELLVLATALAESALGDRFGDTQLLATVAGSRLDNCAVRHPFLDRDSVIVLAEYVDLETGTGAVHTAPGHGADDFETGIKYDLPILNPVNASGHFTDEAGPYAGQFIFKANKQIVKDLEASGHLLRAHEYEHSYPHCWRCHNPVIFRATSQWFIAMDQNKLRERAIAAADAVAYTPDWGETRLKQMLENHPEWCISRQRTWGTPIPAVVCTSCNEAVLDARVVRKAALRFGEVGASAWWSDPVELYLPNGFTCPNCGKTSFEKEKNIVDIWFESGVSHFAVLRDGIPWPSDLVLEGGDQYRGWFRSSIVTAAAIEGAPPYRHVVKNGWVNDEQGRAMSKSKGTGYGAVEAMEKWGADVLRLWAASVEFIDDVRFGPNLVEQVGKVYRNIRNRIRFMLMNLEDLDAASLIERSKMEPLDQLACNITDALVDEVKKQYDAFGIHDAYLRIIEFESAMSSFYFDALKDPLYARARNDGRRRSAQSALLYVLKRFLTAVAPVLSFTAEEAWQEIPLGLRGQEASVFDSSFRVAHAAPASEAEFAMWSTLRDMRAQVASGVKIGDASIRDYETSARLFVPASLVAPLRALGDNLREALVVSQISGVVESDELRVELSPADGEKCKRCWKFRELGTDRAHPSICSDCATVVRGI